MKMNDDKPPPKSAALGNMTTGTADLPLEYEMALQHGLSGLWWASIVAREGISAASVYPLAKKDEDEAQRFAKAVIRPTSAQFREAEHMLDAGTLRALKAFLDCLPLLQQAEGVVLLPEDLSREVDQAVSDVEFLGRVAAKSARILYLLVGEHRGVR